MLAATRPSNENVLKRSGASSTAFLHNSTREGCSNGKRLKLNSRDCSSNAKSLKLNSGSFYLPKDDPKKPEGEDVHFVTEDGCTFGVADGVGGWAKHGIDSGEYARQLMSNSLVAVHNQLLNSGAVVDPMKVLSEAFSNTKAHGSSTACIITLADDKQGLHAVNVGDSGFLIIRKGRTVYRSPVQQRDFNCPYQLGNTKDGPSSAEVIKIEIEEGDVIVVGTDGLFDNMFEKEIEEIVTSTTFEAAATTVKGDKLKPQEVAWKIAELALYNSFDAYNVTPFQLKSEKAGKKHRGGKVDDITVIVSFVQHT